MSENNFMTSDLGAVTAYAAAVEKGYTGTQDEFGQLLANFAGSAQQVAEDRTAVEDAKKAVDQQVSNFDTHVEEKKAEASESISSAANTAKEEGIAAIQETSISGVKSVQDKTAEGIKALETSSQIGVSNINSAVEEGKKNFVTDDTLKISGRAADAKATGDKIGKLKEDIVYKRNTRLIPVQFDTILGYYSSGGFESGKKEWNARLMRVPVKKGDKYLYHGFCDNIYGVSFLNSDLSVIRQIHVPVNEEFEMDIDVVEDASYIDFYSGLCSVKTYVLKYNKTHTDDTDTGKIFIDSSSELITTNDRYFSPLLNDLVNSVGMILKSITPETDTVYKFSFTAMQAASAYIDDFCIVTNNNYSPGTEVFYENIVAFVPAGKTLRINDYNSDIHTSKFEKLIPITEQYINGKIPIVPSVVDIVKNKDMNPVTSNAVYQAIQSSMVNISTGLPFVAVASSEAPSAIKSVCQFVCDGTDDNVEIQSAINSLASTGGKVLLTKGKFFISSPIDTGDTLVELCGEGALLDLHEDTLNSDIRGGTILQAVGNTDLVHIGGAKGTTVHDIAFFGYGRNKADNTSYGIKFTGYADTDRIYNCGFTNCAIAIGSDITTDMVYIHNLSVQRNKIGIALYKTDAEIHDCLFCENIGMGTVVWDDNTYDINCADICVNDGKIYNNTFRRSGMCYDVYKVYGNESGLESDEVKPISSIVLLGATKIIGNYFFDCIYANCIRSMSKTDFMYIEGNSFTKWGRIELEDDSKKAAICFEAGSVLGTIMNNRFYSDSNTQKFTDKYAVYECNTDDDNSYWRYSNTYMNNFIGKLTADTENKCRIVGTAKENQIVNNIVVN
nr:MAG TPA: alpha-1, 3-glucanase [Caudoviricetes sp.]